MFAYLRARAAERRARAQYEMAVIQRLMDENEERMRFLYEPQECPYCPPIKSDGEADR